MELTQELKEKFKIPESAEFNGSVDLVIDDISKVQSKRIQHAIGLFDVDYVGGKSLESISELIKDPLDIFDRSILESLNLQKFIGPDKTMKFIEGIENYKTVKGIKIENIIRCVCMINNLGKTISLQFAKYLSGVEYDFKGLEKNIISTLFDYEGEIRSVIHRLENEGCKIIWQVEEEKVDLSQLKTFVMTGSPKEFGYKTKADFVKELPEGWKEVGKLANGVNYLITDDLNSTSSKMKMATKLGIEIKTYGDF